MHEPAPQLDSSDLRWKHRAFSLRFLPAFLSSLRYPARSALVAELLIFDRYELSQAAPARVQYVQLQSRQYTFLAM